MDHAHLIHQLDRHAAVFEALFHGLTAAEARWKPAPEKWGLLEVVCHLRDEEREDFRARVNHILSTPEAPMPAINPVEWVTSRRYAEQDLSAVLKDFLAERRASVAWLRGLNDAPWTQAYQHPKVGPVRAQLILVNWVAHDLLHIRQINALRYGWLQSVSTEPLDYAGTW
ncbi:MAG: DinB family protein [Flavobacteriales bacterium]|nr:DinB family protein [Flavobacteriales bacterium]